MAVLTAVPTIGHDTTPAPPARWSPLVIRLAVAADEAPLRRLAHMDSARPLSGQALLAEQGGEPVAAISLQDRRAIADPFVPTAVISLRASELPGGR